MSGYICKSCRTSMRQALRLHRVQPFSQAISRARPSPISATNLDINDVQPSERATNDRNEFGSSSNDYYGGKQAVDSETKGHDSIENGFRDEDAMSKPQAPLRRNSKRKLIDVKSLLSKPTWSVRSLLPENDEIPPAEKITIEKLHHLLRLSALPLPKDEHHAQKMIKTLESQLHFVRNIQKVNTDGVEPLRAIRDETQKGIQEITIGMEQLKEAFAKEDIVGKNRRPRRRRGEVVDTKGVEDWDVFGAASETVEVNGAKYFVVRKRDGHEGWKGNDIKMKEEKAAEIESVAENGATEKVSDEGTTRGSSAPEAELSDPMSKSL